MSSEVSIQLAQYRALERLRKQVHDQLGPELVVAKLKLRPLLALLKDQQAPQPSETIETLELVASQLDQALQLCHSIVSDQAAAAPESSAADEAAPQVVVVADWLDAGDRQVVQSAGQKTLGPISTAIGAKRIEILLCQEDDEGE